MKLGKGLTCTEGWHSLLTWFPLNAFLELEKLSLFAVEMGLILSFLHLCVGSLSWQAEGCSRWYLSCMKRQKQAWARILTWGRTAQKARQGKDTDLFVPVPSLKLAPPDFRGFKGFKSIPRTLCICPNAHSLKASWWKLKIRYYFQQSKTWVCSHVL